MNPDKSQSSSVYDQTPIRRRAWSEGTGQRYRQHSRATPADTMECAAQTVSDGSVASPQNVRSGTTPSNAQARAAQDSEAIGPLATNRLRLMGIRATDRDGVGKPQGPPDPSWHVQRARHRD